MDELAALSEEQRQQALERFRLLQPHLEQGKPLVQVAREGGIPFRTGQRRVGRNDKFGLAVLARKVRADRNQRRSLSPKFLEIVKGLALRRPALFANLYRRVFQLTEARGEKPPSYTVIYEIVRALPPDLVTLAQQGSKAYGEIYELIHRHEADRLNAIWQADRTLLDVLVVKEDGTTARLWLTLIEDGYSRAVAGSSSTLRHQQRFRPPSRYARRSGGRMKRAGTSAGFRRCSTRTTGATSPRATWSKWPPT